MKILPSDKYTIVTNLPKKEVLSIFEENVEIGKLISFSSFFTQTRKFRGTISDNSFIITPSTQSGNAFKVVLEGTIRKEDDKTLIDINVELINRTKFIVKFLYIFSLFFLAFIISVTNANLTPIIYCIFFIAYIYTLSTLFFKHFNKKSKKVLLSLLDGSSLKENISET